MTPRKLLSTSLWQRREYLRNGGTGWLTAQLV
jgi:hypothetical protein